MTPTDQNHPDFHRTVRRALLSDTITVYQAVTDIEATARHSTEVTEATWVTRTNVRAASVGDTFVAHNRAGDRSWTSTSVVVAADPGHRFAFAVGGAADPVAVWAFDLNPGPPAPDHPTTNVSYNVTLGAAFTRRPDHHADPRRRISDINRRLDALAHNMSLFLEGIAADLHRTNVATRLERQSPPPPQSEHSAPTGRAWAT